MTKTFLLLLITIISFAIHAQTLKWNNREFEKKMLQHHLLSLMATKY